MIAGDNETDNKFFAGVVVTADKSVIFPAAEFGHGRRWCHWNRHEKLHIIIRGP